MNVVNGNRSNTYLNLVQQATRRNTLTQVADAKQSGQPVDVEQLQSSNQALRDGARETGVALYSAQLQKQTFETYTASSQNQSYGTSSVDENSSDVYTFDASKVNDTLQTVQQRTLAVAAYENLNESREDNQSNRPDFNPLSTQPVNVYV